MKIDILTIFPAFFDSFLRTSIIGKAVERGILDIRTTDIRQYSLSKHKNTDDYPFGGGAGMLMMVQPAADAIRAVAPTDGYKGKRIYLGPKGKRFDQRMAEQLSREENLLLLCGHYEGIDQRVLDYYIDEEISVGDFILTGGEPAALVMIDCIARLIPGVLGSEESSVDESFSSGGLLEYPQYTRPREFEGHEVPSVLLEGNHRAIAQWRREQSLLTTLRFRPDLLTDAVLTEEERQWLKNFPMENPCGAGKTACAEK